MTDVHVPLPGAPEAPAEPRILTRVLWPLELAARVAVGISLVVIVAFTLGQVADRYVLKGAFNAYDQIARIGLVWMAFIGAAMAFRERVNIVVDIADKYFSPRFVAVKAVVLDLLSIVVMVLLVRYGLRLLDVGQYQSVMGTPFTYTIVYLSMVAGSVLYLIFLIARVIAGVGEFVAASKRNVTR